jgi:PAS domain S-box-containing protein
MRRTRRKTDPIPPSDSSQILLDAFPESAFLIEPDGRIAALNATAVERVNARREDIQGRMVWDMFPVEEVTLWRKITRSVLETKDPVRFSDQREGRTYRLEFHPILDDQGEVSRIAFFVKDITARREVEFSLREQNRLFRSLAENTPDIVIRFDRDFRHLYINHAVEAVLGFAPERLLNRTLRDLGMDENLCAAWETGISTVFSTGRPLNTRVEFMGVTGWITLDYRMTPEPGPDWSVSTVLCISRDITDQIHFEKTSEQRLKIIIENMLDMIGQLDEQGRFTFVSPSVRKVLGFDPDELTGRNAFTLMHHEDRERVQSTFKRIVSEGVVGREELRYKTSSGTYLWLEVMAQTACDQSGTPCGIVYGARDITERRRAEEEVRAAQEISESIIRTANSIIVSVDEKGIIQVFNEEAEKITGYRCEEVVGRNWLQLFVPRERYPSVWEHFQHGIRNFPRTFENPILTKEGEERIISWRNSVLKSRGEVHGISFGIDVTEQRRAEKELADSKKRLSTLISNLPGMAYRCANQPSWSMVLASQGALALTGYNTEHLLGDEPSYAEIIHPEDGDRVWCKVQDAVARKEPFELTYRIMTRTGELKWVWEQGRGVCGPDGELNHLEGFITDITEMKRAEEKLLLLSSVVEHAAAPIIIADSDLHILYVNPAFVDLSGFEPHEIVGRETKVLNPEGLPLPDSTWAEIYRSFAEGLPWGGKLEKVAKDGRQYTVVATIAAVRDVTGKIVSYFDYWRDITHEEDLQKQLFQARKMEAIGTLAGGIAHDFNNILATMMGYTELALLKTGALDPVSHELDMVLSAGERAKELVKQILTFSRKWENRKKPLHLTPLVKEGLKMLRATLPTSVIMRITLDAHEDTVRVDPNQMHQVLTNLCTNAAQAMNGEGVLEVSLCNISLPGDGRVESTTMAEERHLSITVRDNGPGMSAEVLERIFDPFFTTKSPGEGTGMGLPVVHGIVKAHMGRLFVESQPGAGATFTVLLPLTSEKPEESPPLKDEEAPTGNERVLFVDDEQSIRTLMETVLRELGYEVDIASNGLEALKMFRDAPNEYDMVITDQTMPHLTGLNLCRKIKTIRDSVPVILCTGHSDAVTRLTLEKAGIDLLMNKPFRISTLAQAIRKILNK